MSSASTSLNTSKAKSDKGLQNHECYVIVQIISFCNTLTPRKLRYLEYLIFYYIKTATCKILAPKLVRNVLQKFDHNLQESNLRGMSVGRIHFDLANCGRISVLYEVSLITTYRIVCKKTRTFLQHDLEYNARKFK